MIYIAYTIHVVVCLFLILVVLLQQGKGADLSVFGGGSTQSAFGARGAATLLHKLTVAGFVAFIVTTITIGFLQGGGSTGSVMSTVPEDVVIEETVEGEILEEVAIPPGETPTTGDDAAVEESPAEVDETAAPEDPPSSDQ